MPGWFHGWCPPEKRKMWHLCLCIYRPPTGVTLCLAEKGLAAEGKTSNKREKRVIRMRHEWRWVWRENYTGESRWSRGKWHRRWVWTFWREQIDPGKLTKQQSDGQVYRKTKRQMDTQTAGSGGKNDGNEKKWDWKREAIERLQWAGYNLAQTPSLFLLLEKWSVNRLKSFKNPTIVQWRLWWYDPQGVKRMD